MRMRKLRLLSVATAAGAVVAGAALFSTAQGHPAALAAVRSASAPAALTVDLDNCPVLAEPYRGGCVDQLQNELNAFGGAHLSVDGFFGAATKNAVIAFQQQHGVSPADGIVGLQTKAALDVASGQAVPTPVLSSPAPGSVTYSPDYKVVRYIHSFSIPRCTLNFISKVMPGGLGTCTAIDATANPTPAADIAANDANWAKFQGSDEYRSIVHLPPYSVTCTTTGQLTGPPTPTSPPGISAGFTPVRAGLHTFHVAGEKYQQQGGIWYDVNPQISLVSPSTARITYRVAARAGTAENDGNPTFSGYSLPFVWTLVQEQLSCGKAPATLVTYSQMPSVMVFQDGVRALADIQTSDLADFVRAGGFGHVLNGQGHLYVPCRVFGMGQLSGVAITPDCAAAASPQPSWAAFPAP